MISGFPEGFGGCGVWVEFDDDPVGELSWLKGDLFETKMS